MFLFSVLILIFVPLCVIGIYFEAVKWWLNLTKLKKYKIINGLPFIGISYKLYGISNDDVIKVMDRLFKQSTKRPLLMWMGPVPSFCIDEPDEMQIILNAEQFIDKPYMYDHLHNKTGLLGSPKDIWKVHRKALNPTFNYKILQSFIPTFNLKARILISKLNQQIGQSPDLNCTIFKCLTDMLLNTQLGTKWEFQSSRGDHIFNMLVELMGFFQRRLVRFWLRWDFIYNLTPEGRRESDVLRRGYRFLRAIKESKALELAHQLDSGDNVLEEAKQRNMLTWIQKCFLMLREGKFSEDHVIEEIDTLFVSGTDTTTVTLVSTIILLAVYQEYQDKVFEEIREVFDSPDSDVNYEDLSKLKFTEMVIKETLRHFPVAPLIARKCTEDFPFKGSVIPNGSLMVLNFHKMHKDERYWGPKVNDFYPEHFLPENVEKMHPYTYLAFSGGPRNCIGIKYAWCVMKLILVYLLRKYKFTTHLKYEDIQAKVCCVLKIVNKYPVRFEPREWK